MVVDTAAPRATLEAHGDVLDTPVAPGSLMKLVALAAALETGSLTPSTRLVCTRRLRYEGRTLDCAHPDLGRPLDAVDALAHSCNSYFAAIGGRVSPSALATAASALGLPPMRRAVDPVLATLGLDEYRVAPRRWLELVARLVDQDSRLDLSQNTVRVLVAGLQAAARTGTAAAFAAHGLDAWAKTGTAPMPGGGMQGTVVALARHGASRVGAVVVAPAGSGRDAAVLGARLIAEQATLTGGDERAPGAAMRTALRLGTARGDHYRVHLVGVEDYVARVVTAETPAEAPAPTQEAMAIVARTFAHRQRGRHDGDGFDLCDLTHCQALRPASDAARRAAARTAGQVLSFGGAAADVYYTASCGGTLEAPTLVWPAPPGAWPAFLQSRPDPAGQLAREVSWQAELDAASLLRVLHAADLRGDRIDDVQVVGRTPAGHVAWLRVAGMHPDTVAGETFRLASGRTVGWQAIKSAAFDVTRTARGFRFTGAGHGHGVGLCVVGASALGRRRTAAEILAAYFPGTRIVASMLLAPRDAAASVPAPSGPAMRIVLSAADERHRGRIERLLRQILGDVAGRLREPLPASLTVRFHPSVDSYQRATGLPWWTTAATRQQRIEVLPLEALDRSHRLERTLRHELVHVLTAPRLQGRPLWVVEGIAHYFASTTGAFATGDLQNSETCPDDTALRRAQSGAALADLYDRAAACVAGLISQGRPWDEIP
jgi:stage II sporulation protein D